MRLDNLDKVLAALAVLLTAVLPLVKAWVQTKLTPTRLAHVNDLARIAVRAAEKVGEDADGVVTGAAKYKVASDALVATAKRLGVKLNPDEVNAFILSALRELQQNEKAAATVSL